MDAIGNTLEATYKQMVPRRKQQSTSFLNRKCKSCFRRALGLFCRNFVYYCNAFFASLQKATVTRSVDMAASMNAMMEQYLVGSIDIRTHVEGSENDSDAVRIKITVSNRSQLAVQKCDLQLNVSSVERRKPIPFELEVDSRPNFKKDTEKKNDHKEKNPKLVDSMFTLEPGKKYEWTITVEIKRMHQCNGCVEIMFPSIGTGAMLTVSHVFGLYLIHRCKRMWTKSHGIKNCMAVAVSFDGGFLRSFFRVPHDEGIIPGSAFKLSVAGHTIMLPVNKVVGTEVELLVHVVGACFPKEEIVEDVLLELDMYSRFFTERNNPFSKNLEGTCGC